MNAPMKPAAKHDLQQQLVQLAAMSDEDRFLAGARLFDMAYRVTLDGIRNESPDMDEKEALAVLIERLRQARLLEQRQLRQKVDEHDCRRRHCP